MWSNSPDDDKEVNELFKVVDRQIADMTEACEPILTWDGMSKKINLAGVLKTTEALLTELPKIPLIPLQAFVGLFKSKMKIA